MPLFVRVFRAIALILIVTVTASSFGYGLDPAPPIQSAVLHDKLVAHGIGKRVKVTETSGTVVKGVLVSIEPDSFQITPKDKTQPITIQNTQVAKLGNDGLSTTAKVWIGVGIGVFVALGILGTRI